MSRKRTFRLIEPPPEPPPEPEPPDPTLDPDEPSKSVMGEVNEAFTEIGAAFFKLRDSFKAFGTVLGLETQNLGKTIKSSVNNIILNVDNVNLRFKRMAENLANNLSP